MNQPVLRHRTAQGGSGVYNIALTAFDPLFTNHHLATIAGNLWLRRLDTPRYPVEAVAFESEPGVKVLVQIQRAPGAPRGTMVLVHGLEGSGEAGYMRSMAQAALDAGYTVHRFNLRTCGGTDQWCKTLYHAGLTTDLLAWLRRLESEECAPVYLTGYSLGGNVVLKLAGELGDAARGLIAGVCALSTPIDLAACARKMGLPENRFYDWRFVRRMRHRIGAMGRFPKSELRRAQSIYEFDDRITAPSFGFRDAEHYYSTQSSQGFLDRIRVRTLLVQAEDDTFIPFSVYRHAAFGRNPQLELLVTKHGGHLGFLSRRGPRFWADQTVLAWAGR